MTSNQKRGFEPYYEGQIDSLGAIAGLTPN